MPRPWRRAAVAVVVVAGVTALVSSVAHGGTDGVDAGGVGGSLHTVDGTTYLVVHTAAAEDGGMVSCDLRGGAHATLTAAPPAAAPPAACRDGCLAFSTAQRGGVPPAAVVSALSRHGACSFHPGSGAAAVPVTLTPLHRVQRPAAAAPPAAAAAPAGAADMAWVLRDLAAAGGVERDYDATWLAAFGDDLAPAPAFAPRLEAALGGLRMAGVEVGAALAGMGSAALSSAAARRALIANATRAYVAASAASESPRARLAAATANSGGGGGGGRTLHAAAVAAELHAALAAAEAPAGGVLLEVPRRAGARDATRALVTMLLEVHTTTAALVAAGVTSKEIFACVVDLLMDAAPEIILQIIISVVRDPIVNVVGMIMALILPPILVPAPPPERDDGGRLRLLEVHTDAQAGAWAWLHDSAYATPPGGPLAHMMPKLKEGILAGLSGVALPRLATGAGDRLKSQLDATLLASLHRGVSRALILSLTARLTHGIFTRTAATVARPLAAAAATTLVERVAPPLSHALSRALAQALSRHPAADYFCWYCDTYAAANGTAPATGAVEPHGAYCTACRRSRAHDALLDAQVDAAVRAASAGATRAALQGLGTVLPRVA